MIEKTLRSYLVTALNGVPVLMEAPEVPSADFPEFPDQLVLIERVGGNKQNLIQTGSFAIQSYGKSLLEAVALDEEVRAAMEEFVTVENIGAVSLSSCYNHTDTRTGKYRYQSTFDVTFVETGE